jgi:hypothetical protein
MIVVQVKSFDHHVHGHARRDARLHPAERWPLRQIEGKPPWHMNSWLLKYTVKVLTVSSELRLI